MLKFLLVILGAVFILIVAFGIFIKKLLKSFGISFRSDFNNSKQSRRQEKVIEEDVLFKDGATTVLRGEAKKDELKK